MPVKRYDHVQVEIGAWLSKRKCSFLPPSAQVPHELSICSPQFPDSLRMDDFVYQKTAPKKKKLMGGDCEVKSLSDRKPASSKVSLQVPGEDLLGVLRELFAISSAK